MTWISFLRLFFSLLFPVLFKIFMHKEQQTYVTGILPAQIFIGYLEESAWIPHVQFKNEKLISATKAENLKCLTQKLKVFRYSFWETIPMFFNPALKMILSLSDRYKILTID